MNSSRQSTPRPRPSPIMVTGWETGAAMAITHCSATSCSSMATIDVRASAHAAAIKELERAALTQPDSQPRRAQRTPGSVPSGTRGSPATFREPSTVPSLGTVVRRQPRRTRGGYSRRRRRVLTLGRHHPPRGLTDDRTRCIAVGAPDPVGALTKPLRPHFRATTDGQVR
jgi:hypothetical protein